MDKPKKILIISSDKNLREVLKFCFDGWGYEVVLYDSMAHDVGPIKKISPDVIVVDVHTASKFHLEICQLLKDDFITAFIPVITLINKRQLRSQLLSIKQGVDDYLIKPPDPLDLRIRVDMAIKRSQYTFYASPLTGIPGGRIIEEMLKDKIAAREPFSFGYLDLDNFKYFNDVYGYLKGDRVIMQSAYMLYTTIKKFGNKDDFIGHIGGDDFVFISTADKYKDICHNFIMAFDQVIPFHYSDTDRGNGYVIARDRTHVMKKIPLMSVSIAVVNNARGPLEFKNVIEVNERVAEVKRYLKNFNGSKFMTDRRSAARNQSSKPEIYKREISAKDKYMPLGQALIKRRAISKENLDVALPVHWRKGILLGEVLKELGFVRDEELKKALTQIKR